MIHNKYVSLVTKESLEFKNILKNFDYMNIFQNFSNKNIRSIKQFYYTKNEILIKIGIKNDDIDKIKLYIKEKNYDLNLKKEAKKLNLKKKEDDSILNFNESKIESIFKKNNNKFIIKNNNKTKINFNIKKNLYIKEKISDLKETIKPEKLKTNISTNNNTTNTNENLYDGNCWFCLKYINKSNSINQSIVGDNKYFCSKICIQNVLKIISVGCNICQKLIIKPNGILYNENWFCSDSCLDTGINNIDLEHSSSNEEDDYNTSEIDLDFNLI